MKQENDYLEALAVEGIDLYAVQLQDGGWSIADGLGALLTPADESELAGWHLPVRFKSPCQAQDAIKDGPSDWFDISIDSKWSKHAMSHGAVYDFSYVM